MDPEKLRRISAGQAMMSKEEFMVCKCACSVKRYHTMGVKCCICASYANSKCKMVSQSEYYKIVVNAEKIKMEYN